MTKKWIGSVLLVGLASTWALPWGLHRDFIFLPGRNNKDYRSQEYAPYTKSPLYYILQRGKSNFTVCVEEWGMRDLDPRQNKPEDLQFRLLKETFPAWITKTRAWVQQTGRSNEFADLLSWLPAQITVTRVSCDQNPDIRLNIMRTAHIAGSAMWYHDQQRQWRMNLAYPYSDRSVGLHESGHFFGLGDLTARHDRENRSSYSSSHNTTDLAHSLYAVGVTHGPQDSVMWWNTDESNLKDLSCDDVEGFINAVDFVQFMSGETSPRLENGWKSLCGRPYYYLRGQVAQDETQLPALKQQTSQQHVDKNVLTNLQQLREKWLDYQDRHILPLLTQKRKELTGLQRPLNDEGLMLSAQVTHLRHVLACAENAIDIINDAGNHAARTGQTVDEVQQKISQLPCVLGGDPLKAPGWEQATPQPEDYPTGKTHVCAICGKQIALGEEQYAQANFKKQGKWVTRGYFRHKTCSGITPQKAMAYKDHVEEVSAPTYAELLTRSKLAKSLRATRR